MKLEVVSLSRRECGILEITIFHPVSDRDNGTMDNMEELWGKLRMIEEEEAIIEITEDEVEHVRRKGDLCLVGKLWMDSHQQRGSRSSYG